MEFSQASAQVALPYKKRSSSIQSNQPFLSQAQEIAVGNVHAKIMKSTLGRAISLKKFDSQWHSPNHNSLLMPAIHTQSCNTLINNALGGDVSMISNQKVLSQQQNSGVALLGSGASGITIGYSNPSSELHKTLKKQKQKIQDVWFNNKEMKNLSFLPFLRERNGLGRIIESVSTLKMISLFCIGIGDPSEAQKGTYSYGDQENPRKQKEAVG